MRRLRYVVHVCFFRFNQVSILSTSSLFSFLFFLFFLLSVYVWGWSRHQHLVLHSIPMLDTVVFIFIWPRFFFLVWLTFFFYYETFTKPLTGIRPIISADTGRAKVLVLFWMDFWNTCPHFLATTNLFLFSLLLVRVGTESATRTRLDRQRLHHSSSRTSRSAAAAWGGWSSHADGFARAQCPPAANSQQ